uniref:Uncharacterized protein n=1 Tax=Arundo donax TaxID=35708 RepID=A0A0A9DR55_ARUDO
MYNENFVTLCAQDYSSCYTYISKTWHLISTARNFYGKKIFQEVKTVPSPMI